MLEAHYSLDTFLYEEILKAAEHVYNNTPNTNTSPLTLRQMVGDHVLYRHYDHGSKDTLWHCRQVRSSQLHAILKGRLVSFIGV